MNENKKSQNFNKFVDILIKIGENIDQHYFRIQTAGNEEYVFRERVYCYELYHRLREKLPSDFYYKLDGELDKRGQEFFRRKKMKYIPDFIVHIPGDKRENLVIIEVKQINRDNLKIDDIKSDIEKLIRFIDEVGYFRGIMLIYSDDLSKFPQDLIDSINSKIQNRKEQILILFHSAPNKRIRIIEV